MNLRIRYIFLGVNEFYAAEVTDFALLDPLNASGTR